MMIIMYLVMLGIGIFIGGTGMAILASGGKADEVERSCLYRAMLFNVLLWHRSGKVKPFPEDEIAELLKELG